jgi:hypothetical protein
VSILENVTKKKKGYMLEISELKLATAGNYGLVVSVNGEPPRKKQTSTMTASTARTAVLQQQPKGMTTGWKLTVGMVATMTVKTAEVIQGPTKVVKVCCIQRVRRWQERGQW